MNGMMNHNIIIDVSTISSIIRTRGLFPTPIVGAVLPPDGGAHTLLDEQQYDLL